MHALDLITPPTDSVELSRRAAQRYALELAVQGNRRAQRKPRAPRPLTARLARAVAAVLRRPNIVKEKLT